MIIILNRYNLYFRESVILEFNAINLNVCDRSDLLVFTILEMSVHSVMNIKYN